MIKHVASSLSKPDRINESAHYNEFDTFQQCPNELNSVASNRDSLLFSQSRKADETNKEIGQVLSSISKQDWKQYQNNRGSSIKKIRGNQTNNQQFQGEFADPLAQYMISSIEARNASNPKIKITQSRHQIPAFTICQRCKYMEEDHRKELMFLTKNNQQLYELNKRLSQQLNQFVKKYESLQRQHSNFKKENSLLLKEIEIQREKKESMREKYYQRQKKYLKQKEFHLKTHEQQLKIVEKISECLHEKQMQSRQKKHNRSQAQPIQQHSKRAKTQYQYDRDIAHNKQTSTMATWQGSCSKYTPRKTAKNRDLFSDEKIQKEVDRKVDKLSQEKKKIMSRVIKQNLTIDDLQTQIPQTALNKIGKGTVGKLTLAKGNLGRGSNLYGGSISSVPTQKKCR